MNPACQRIGMALEQTVEALECLHMEIVQTSEGAVVSSVGGVT